MIRQAGPIRRIIHARMLRLDEALCRRWGSLPGYGLPATKAGAKMSEFLAICASGQLELHYENGLAVPRSLFHSRHAVLLLSARPGTRRLVRTPYGFGSGREILVSEQAAKSLDTACAGETPP